MEKTLYEKATARLDTLQEMMSGQADVCSSGGTVSDFPACMKEGVISFGIGLIVCHEGEFEFTLSGRSYKASRNETVFMPEGGLFRVTRQSADVLLSLIIYHTESIRDIMGAMVQSVHLYTLMSSNIPCVWSTGCENDIARYISLIKAKDISSEDFFSINEHKLLLLSLTYRLCSVFSQKFLSNSPTHARRTEIFLKLIRLIDRHFMHERGVAFYADKLCLSPKYLSELSKSVCGYTVQELVFKNITRKAMSLLDSTHKTVAEISDELNFPTPSSFGTFFRKQTGLSPQKYRNQA